jgi:hypothetical protein
MIRAMLRFAVLALALALGGCSARMHVNTNTVAPSAPPPGTAVHGAGVRVHIHGGSLAAAVIAAVFLAAAWEEERRGEAAFGPRETAPPLAPNRHVNEQECTRPIADASANLKCR